MHPHQKPQWREDKRHRWVLQNKPRCRNDGVADAPSFLHERRANKNDFQPKRTFNLQWYRSCTKSTSHSTTSHFQKHQNRSRNHKLVDGAWTILHGPVFYFKRSAIHAMFLRHHETNLTATNTRTIRRTARKWMETNWIRNTKSFLG